ncbi:FBD-associated F-box protein [Hibiscus syriacus]|uniref:FBD-associated F-box protein n=1 Tax=Hibiscus syriacus TaxID=106335 RepID=A0A6A2XGL5_HIBSY|nr:FBD-associated F-box protein [Hibiscus syriacus]
MMDLTVLHSSKGVLAPNLEERPSNCEISSIFGFQGGAEPPQKKKGRKNSMQMLKTAMLISAVAVAVAGVVIVITKKLKEK